MKDGLENIEEVFKEAFDGFEANDDPSVWSNIQSTIGSSAASTTAAGVAGKSLALKIVAGVIALGTVVTGVYIVPTLFGNEEEAVIEKTVVDESTEEKNNIVIENRKEELVSENHTKEVVEQSVVENNLIKEDTESRSENFSETGSSKHTGEMVASVKEQESNSIIAESSQENTSEGNSTTVKAENFKQKEKSIAVETKEVKPLVAIISSNKKSGKAPLDVVFDVDGENIVSYSWDFRDGSEGSNSSNPIHTFNTPGVYNVMLVVVDENANSKQIPYQIKVEKENTATINETAIPRKFSPNGDGVNDVLKIEGANIKKFQATVYKMNGDKVYEWRTLEGFWDGGDMNGNKVDNGIYYLQVIFSGEDGQQLKPIKKSITVY